MMISICEPNLITSDDLLQIAEEKSHNKEKVSLKQCLLEDNYKVVDLIYLNQVDPSLSVSMDNEFVPKKSSPPTDSHHLKKHIETLFNNIMSVECSKFIHSVVIYDDLLSS